MEVWVTHASNYSTAAKLLQSIDCWDSVLLWHLHLHGPWNLDTIFAFENLTCTCRPLRKGHANHCCRETINMYYITWTHMLALCPIEWEKLRDEIWLLMVGIRRTIWLKCIISSNVHLNGTRLWWTMQNMKETHNLEICASGTCNIVEHSEASCFQHDRSKFHYCSVIW